MSAAQSPSSPPSEAAMSAAVPSAASRVGSRAAKGFLPSSAKLAAFAQ